MPPSEKAAGETLLTGDIGNTCISLEARPAAGGAGAPFAALRLRDARRERARLRAWLEEHAIELDHSLLLYAAVAPRRAAALLAILAELGLRRSVPAAGPRCPLDLENRCRPPDAVGLDRLLAASQARHLCAADVVLVDCGTAVTVDAVSAGGVFHGGAIAPGARLMAQALQRGAELLPEVVPRALPARPGADTESAIALALHHGLAGLIDRLVEVVGTDLEEPCAMLCGGDAERLSPALRTPHRLGGALVHGALARLWVAGGRRG